MNHTTIFIRSFAIVDGNGIATPKARFGWDADQSGPGDIRRAQVLPTPYVAFGKLNLPDKLAFSAASLALRDGPGKCTDRTGVFLAVPGGSYSTDCSYRVSVEQGNPSPALFSATLPSSPVADIAIFHHLTGPNVVFAGGDAPFFAAIEYTVLMMKRSRLEEALIVLVDEPVAAEAGVPSAANACSLALHAGTTPGPTPIELSLESADTLPADARSPVADPEICAALRHAFEKTVPVRLPVCSGGFRGYICVKTA